jgi:hypothetical protein
LPTSAFETALEIIALLIIFFRVFLISNKWAGLLNKLKATGSAMGVTKFIGSKK